MLDRFIETDEKKLEQLQKDLDTAKLENVRSLWYIITASGGKIIAGSKG